MFWKIIISIAFFLIVVAISLFNRLVKLRSRAKEAWADIDVQLKRRHNLIPNLIETVKGYASHEKEVLEKITEARSRAMQATDLKQKQETENALSATLKSLFAISENYPQLRASENFLELQRELRDTEDKIQAARRFYNSNVRDLNIRIQVFPSNMISKIFNFKKMEFFEVKEAEEKKPVSVKF